MAKAREARGGLTCSKLSLLGTQTDGQIYEAGLVQLLQAELMFGDWCFGFLSAHLCLLTLNPPSASAVKFPGSLPIASPLSFISGTLGAPAFLV